MRNKIDHVINRYPEKARKGISLRPDQKYSDQWMGSDFFFKIFKHVGIVPMVPKAPMEPRVSSAFAIKFDLLC